MSAPPSAPAGSRWPQLARVRGRQRAGRSGKVGYAPLPKGPRAPPTCTAAPASRSPASPPGRRKAAWLFLVWATAPGHQVTGLTSKVGGGTPTRNSVYELPEVAEAGNPPSKMPNMLTTDAVREAWKPENIGLRPKIPMWNECDTALFTEVSRMLAGEQCPEECMRNAKDGFDRHRPPTALRNAVTAAVTTRTRHRPRHAPTAPRPQPAAAPSFEGKMLPPA